MTDAAVVVFLVLPVLWIVLMGLIDMARSFYGLAALLTEQRDDEK